MSLSYLSLVYHFIHHTQILTIHKNKGISHFDVHFYSLSTSLSKILTLKQILKNMCDLNKTTFIYLKITNIYKLIRESSLANLILVL